ncbi:hypothetical protein EK0264_18750 [Epidermidibacterium keratini]|uniref:Uncharacterized protein n=1 Tax=Epidermidibacterium keratini TaxID=1891644 RepID=A0A7L4YTK1_9ACTN|nr:hypothetical protein [Epidermidibacterium keratini]QHC02109.1 hypothetical protein EK0264_18750 [Epidermidibacterium keratini]
MDEEHAKHHRRAAGYGLAVGFALFLPLHIALSRTTEAATALTIVGALAAALPTRHFWLRPGSSRVPRPDRGEVSTFGVVIAMLATMIAILPITQVPRPLSDTQNAAEEIPPGQRGGLLPDASAHLASLVALASSDDPAASEAVTEIAVDSGSARLTVYGSGQLRSYVADTAGARQSGSTTAIDATVAPYPLSSLSLGDLNELFENSLSTYEFATTNSDTLRIASDQPGAVPTVTITVGALSPSPKIIEPSVDGVLPTPFSVATADDILDEIGLLLQRAGQSAEAPVIGEIVTQSEGKWQTPIRPLIATPLGTSTGALLRLTDGSGAVMHTLGTDPRIIGEEPGGGAGFALNELNAEMLAQIIDDAAKPYALTGDDMGTVAMRIAAQDVDGTVQPVVELQFSSTPGSVAAYALNGERLS